MPRSWRSRAIVSISIKSGTLPISLQPEERIVAAMMGRAAFLEPEILTLPRILSPPLITILSIPYPMRVVMGSYGILPLTLASDWLCQRERINSGDLHLAPDP